MANIFLRQPALTSVPCAVVHQAVQSAYLAMDSRFHGGLRPRYAWRVTFNGRVIVTTDPIEVARIRHAYPAAQVQVVPVN